jgi:hypothetical protein
VAVRDRHDFRAFAALYLSNLSPLFGGSEASVDKGFPDIQGTFEV